MSDQEIQKSVNKYNEIHEFSHGVIRYTSGFGWLYITKLKHSDFAASFIPEDIFYFRTHYYRIISVEKYIEDSDGDDRNEVMALICELFKND